jgi:hypothetical protein
MTKALKTDPIPYKVRRHAWLVKLCGKHSHNASGMPVERLRVASGLERERATIEPSGLVFRYRREEGYEFARQIGGC